MGTLSAFTSCKIWIYRPSNSFSALTLNNFISPASSTLVPVIHKIYYKMFWHFVNLWSMKAVIDQMLLILFRVWPCRRVTYVIINDSNKFLCQGIFIIIVKGKTQSLSLIREVVKQKNGYFTVRLTVSVDAPPPYSQFLWFSHFDNREKGMKMHFWDPSQWD